jgi:DNA-binding MarR family transcriptional regulator
MKDTMRYEEDILLNIRKIMRAVDTYSSQLARNFGLTTPQLICLKKLDDEGEMTPSALAKSINLSHATITGIISRLEKKHLITKTRSIKDGRSFMISINDKGLSMVRSAPSMLQERFLTELSRLAEWEKTQILSSLQRVSSILMAESIEAAPVLMTGPVEAPAEMVTNLLDSSSNNQSK